ncbi:MAG TPA: hypothetical protein VGD33_07640 [Chitinophagaceae bacterium]
MLEIEKLVYLNPEKAILGPMHFTVTAVEKEGVSEMYLCQEGYKSGATGIGTAKPLKKLSTRWAIC